MRRLRERDDSSRSLAFLLFCLFLPAAVLGLASSASAQTPKIGLSPTKTVDEPPQAPAGLAKAYAPSELVTGQSDPLYDEQLATTFTQSFTSLLYYVTAVQQKDAVTGTGPAYLLNGLSNAGYWYQVGLSWDWSAGRGFEMNYEVFNSTGYSVFPASGGGGLLRFSGPVHEGDNVTLNLYFSAGQVEMIAADQDTGAHASESYSAEGATYFVGSPDSTANSQGFFTGLMTEWYHSAPFYGGEQEVVYSQPGFALSSAWMWVDEFSCSNVSCSVRSPLFFNATSGPISYTSDAELQEFSSHGATVASDSYEFVTGSPSEVSLTLSYSIVGGGSAPSPPDFSYVFDRMPQQANLTPTPTTYLVDADTAWNVTGALAESSQDERWLLSPSQSAEGVANSSQDVEFVYYHQFLVSFGFQVSGPEQLGLYLPPGVTFRQFGYLQTVDAGNEVWADGGNYSYQNPLPGSTDLQRWYSNASSGTVESAAPITVTYFDQYLETFNFVVTGGGSGAGSAAVSYVFCGNQAAVTLNATTWADAGSDYSYSQTLPGSGAAQRWEANSGMGVVDSSLSLDVEYQHQFYARVTARDAAGGTVSPQSGWFSSGEEPSLGATPYVGWKFEGWNGTGPGSYSGSSNSTVIAVNAPVNESAVFYPSLTLGASGGGSVSYGYQGGAGTFGSGNSHLIFVPPGARVVISASPSSPLYSFKGWDNGSTSESLSLGLNSPVRIQADFGYNIPVVAGLAGTVATLATVIAVILRRKRRYEVLGGKGTTLSPSFPP